MAFPSTPTNGQIAIVGGVAYQYATVTNSWGRISTTANVITANIITVGTLTANTLNVNNSLYNIAGNISATGNVTGNYILGNGSLLTGIATGSSSNISNGNSNISLASSGGNATVNITGTSNVAVFATTGEYVTGVVSATGNVTGGNILTGGLISATGTLSVTGVTTLAAVGTGNLAAGNITTGGLISAGGNITGGNINTTNLSVSGNVLGNLLPSANVTYNLGSPTQRWNTIYLAGNTIELGPQSISATATGVSMGTGNVAGGNVTTGGLISATGNITANNGMFTTIVNTASHTGAVVSVTGNVTGGNISTAGQISATGTITSNAATNSTAFAVGNSAVSNVALGMFPTAGTSGEYAIRDYSNVATNMYFDVGMGGTANGAFQFRTSNSFRQLANINSTGITTPLAISATGNITGSYFIGNGSQLTGISGGGGGSPGGSNTQVQFNDGGAFGGNGQFVYNKVTNILTVGNIAANANGQGTNYAVGDDGYIGDINVADTIGIKGQQNGANGYIVFGNSDSTAKLGRAGTGPLTYAGAFSATANVTANNGIFTNIVNVASHTGAVVSVTGNVTGGNISTAGNLTLSGTGQRILADFSSVPVANRAMFQTSTANGATNIYIIPSGTAVNTSFTAVNNSDPTNAGIIQLAATSTDMRVASDRTGAGTYLPLTMLTSGSERFRIDTNGNVGIGNTAPTTNLAVAGTAYVSGNITGGNISATAHTGAVVSVTGNVTANNGMFTTIVNVASHTGAVVSVTGNVTGGNVSGTLLTGTLATAAQANITSVGTLGALAVSGNVTAGNVTVGSGVSVPSGSVLFNGTTQVLTVPDNAVFEMSGDFTVETWFYMTLTPSASTTVLSKGAAGVYQPYYITFNSNTTLVFYSSSTGTSWDVASAVSFGAVSLNTWNHVAVSRVGTAMRLFLNGALITTITNGSALYDNTRAVGVGGRSDTTELFTGYISNTRIVKGVGVYTSAFTPATAPLTSTQSANQNGNPSAAITGTSTSLLLNTVNGANFLTDSSTNNFTVTNTGTATSNSLTPFVSTSGTVTSTFGVFTGNLTAAGVLTVNSGAAATAIVNGASNAVGNIGSSTTYFNRLFAQATTALYADLAEVYKSDAQYPPGTVLVFGGNQEVTVSTQSHDARIAGVVSTNPAHVMNSGMVAEFTVEVGLIGRVPCQVIGPIAAGDRVVSSNRAGVAERLDMQHYQPGVIIGKAVESYNGTGVGTIEVVVGRL